MRKNRNPLTLRQYNKLIEAEIVRRSVKQIVIKEQYQNEKDFIVQNENLIENINVMSFYKKLKNFDIQKFFEVNKEEFYTPDSVDFFNYFTKAVLFSSRKNYRFYRRIRYWIEDLESISKGGYGSTYSARVRGSTEDGNRLFLLKFDKKGEKEIYLHEYFIGNFFINKLRKHCPNFSMVFGLIKCSLPESIFGFGREYKKISCLVYEYIYPATTFSRFLEECSLDAYVSIFLQMVFALRIAAEKIGFTHNDFHLGNIMIKKLDKETLIPYEYKGEKIYVHTTSIAVIIDYGLSRIELKSRNFGPYGIPYNTMNSYEKCYPIKDVFSMLLDSARITGNYFNNEECFAFVNEILKGFFISGIRSRKRYEIMMKKTWLYPFLPHLEGVEGLDIFIDWMFENFGEEIRRVILTEEEVLRIPDKENYFIFDCNLSACLSLEEIYDKIYKKKPIDDIFYYYDIFQYNINVKPPKLVIEKTEVIIRDLFLEVKKDLLSLEVLEAQSQSEKIKKKNYEKTIEVYLKIRDLDEIIKVFKVFQKPQPNILEKLLEMKARINGILKKLYKKKITAIINGNTEAEDFVIPSFIF